MVEYTISLSPNYFFARYFFAISDVVLAQFLAVLLAL